MNLWKIPQINKVRTERSQHVTSPGNHSDFDRLCPKLSRDTDLNTRRLQELVTEMTKESHLVCSVLGVVEMCISRWNWPSIDMYAGVIRLLYFIGSLYLIGVWFSENQWTNIITTHVYKIFFNYFTLNSQHDWEDLCIQLRNQQTCTFDNNNEFKGSPILFRFLVILHCGFVVATKVWLCKSNR